MYIVSAVCSGIEGIARFPFNDASFILELLQWTTSLRWMNEIIHVLKMKYFIQELFGRFLLHLVHLLHLLYILSSSTSFSSSTSSSSFRSLLQYMCTVKAVWSGAKISTLVVLIFTYFWYVICCLSKENICLLGTSNATGPIYVYSSTHSSSYITVD